MNDTPADNTVPAEHPSAEKQAGWLQKNFMPVLFVAAVVGVIAWYGPNVADVALAALGLGLVIFLHELGHFLAAKWCDVHVSTFSIGFGKAIPGCQFRYGETTYKLGWIPLGGYVQMVGEGENADSEEADEDPRSFKNKGVYQRMLIISAGVVMNLILGITCFVVAYSHGVEEPPGIIGSVAAGSPAWQAGIRADSMILQIGGIEKPTYPDIRTKVMGSWKGDIITLRLRHRDGTEETVAVSPKRDEGELFPTIGIVQADQLSLFKSPKGGPARPFREGSSAKFAEGPDGNGFLPGDKIVATSADPADVAAVKALPVDPLDPAKKKLDFFEFRDRMQLLRDKTVTVRVDRDGTLLDIPVAPEYTLVLPGVRFQTGRITAVRADSPAARAKPVEGASEPGLQAVNAAVADSGDRLIAVEVTKPDGKKKRFVDAPAPKADADAEAVTLDPVRLPFELSEWAESWLRRSKGADQAKLPPVRVTVMRSADAAQKTPRRCVFDVEWDANFRFAHDITNTFAAPLTLAGLGVGYQVETAIDAVEPGSAADRAGLKRSDVITAVRHKYLTPNDKVADQKEWSPLKQNHGAYFTQYLQLIEFPDLKVKVKRPVENENRDEELEIDITAVRDTSWPQNARGFNFEPDTRTQKAEDFWEAVQFGGQRTVRMIRTIYQQLYALVSGRISVKSMNGPLSIANISYKIVGHDIWTFIVFIGMISLNLAVVNFLPIPVLDGGHMAFLLYEKIRGKPAPEKLMEWSMYIGLGLILSLMAFVIYLDVKRLFL